MKYEQSVAADIPEQEKTYRAAISNDPALSHFLETGSIRPNAKFAKETIYRDPAFLAFISPYFHEVYVNATIRAFDQKDTILMSDIAVNTILLDDAYRKQAFDDILVYLEQRKSVLTLFHATLQLQEPVDVFILTEHTGTPTICNLNYLPGEFMEFRSGYAQVIMKVINALVEQNMLTSMKIVIDLRQLRVDMQTSKEVKALYQHLHANRPESIIKQGADDSRHYIAPDRSHNSGNSNESGGFSRIIRNIVIGIIVFIAIIIRLLFGWHDRGYRSRSYHSPSYYSSPRYRR